MCFHQLVCPASGTSRITLGEVEGTLKRQEICACSHFGPPQTVYTLADSVNTQPYFSDLLKDFSM